MYNISNNMSLTYIICIGGVFVSKIISFMKKHSLSLVGALALAMGTLMVTEGKYIFFHQPECPKELQ